MEMENLYNLFCELDRKFRIAHPEISCVTTDSRNCPEGSLFFALKGENFNGNAYAAKALEQGAAYAVIDEPQYAQDDRYIVVDNTLKTLQRLACEHRIVLGKPIIGITGTNGKTTTKELTAAVLSQKYNVHYTKGNLNNHIGVPLTLLQMTDKHDIGIIEMGASHPGDIKELVEIACPNAGIITNVGKAHLQGFGSFEGVMKTKGELYDYIRANQGFIFRNIDNPYLSKMAGDLPVHTYSLLDNVAEVSGKVLDCTGFLSMEMHVGGQTFALRTHLVGAYNAENVLAAACIGNTFGVASEEIKRAIEGYVPQNNRSMLVKSAYNTIVVDAYNANPTSMKAAIENFAQMHMNHQTLILGDMLELGEQSEEEHKKIVELLVQNHFTDVYLVGKEFAATASGFSHFSDVNALAQYLKEHPIRERYVLLKGSRGIKLEQLQDYL